MLDITDQQFHELINLGLESLPGEHVKNIQNVAILLEDQPTPAQRTTLALRHDQTLLGLYEGVPLSQRQGREPTFPDRITLFKLPLLNRAETLQQLQEEIRHTLWHEIGHYYGLDHTRIHELE
ncbi:MAG: zn-dependent protease [Candidatus Saccharibacteria bacterium]|nr:zn-dependent protease [Candidatus Saccharibacteria bacterium]